MGNSGQVWVTFSSEINQVSGRFKIQNYVIQAVILSFWLELRQNYLKGH